MNRLEEQFQRETEEKAKALSDSEGLGEWNAGEGVIRLDYERGLIAVGFGVKIHTLAMLPDQAFVFGMAIAQAAREMLENSSNEPS